MKKILQYRFNYDYFVLFFLIIILPFTQGKRFNDLFLIIGVGLCLLGVLFKKNRILTMLRTQIFNNVIILFTTCLFILLFIFVANNRGASDIIRILQFLFCFIVLLYAILINWDKQLIRFIKTILKVEIFFAFILGLLNGFPSGYSFVFSHFNTLGAVCLISIIILLLPCHKRTDFLFLLFPFILLLTAMSRTCFIVSLLYLILIPLLKICKSKSSIIRIVIFSCVIFIIGFVLIYPSLYGSDLGWKIEQWSRDNLNKNFFSGRQVIWANILDAMRDKKIFGYGLSMIPEYLYDTNLSSHNLYLQTYLQGGFIGVTLLVILFYFLMKNILLYKNNLTPYYVAIFVAILVHECFEVTLLQNQLSIGFIFWILFGFMISNTCKIYVESGRREYD